MVVLTEGLPRTTQPVDSRLEVLHRLDSRFHLTPADILKEHGIPNEPFENQFGILKPKLVSDYAQWLADKPEDGIACSQDNNWFTAQEHYKTEWQIFFQRVRSEIHTNIEGHHVDWFNDWYYLNMFEEYIIEKEGSDIHKNDNGHQNGNGHT